jgi:AcrR family transcriptional regulator
MPPAAKVQARPRDAAATRARILAAATTEFARHGLAGARVDRIAQQAEGNKRLIYMYFGSKEKLFDAVLERSLEDLIEAVPFTPEDLPTYAARVFDYRIEHPELVRLYIWRGLERPTLGEGERLSYEKKLAAIAAAQQEGRLNDTYAPADVMALLIGITSSFDAAAPLTQEHQGGDPLTSQRLAEQRAAIIATVTRALGTNRRPPSTLPSAPTRNRT